MAGPDTCRLCMNTGALIDIFKLDAESAETSIVKKVNFCVDIKVSVGDGMPSVICKMCEMNIQIFYEFKQKCLNNDKKLRTIIPISNKLTLDESDFDSIKMDVKLECDLLNKMDSELPNSFSTWLSDDADSDFYADCFDQSVNKDEEKETTSEQVIINSSNSHDVLIHKQQTFKTSRKCMTSYKIYQCEICGRIVKNKSVLAKHIATHSGVKQFSCKLCSKTFTRAEHKVIHMRTHLGIKPFICEICGRSFTKRQDLIMHMRIHSDEKKYSCSICDRRFKRSNDARSHMRTHTGARPYSCSNCNKSYTSHSGLRKHYNAHCKKEIGVSK